MSNLVTIFGGSGFVGRYIAQELAREGWRVRVAVRRPNEAMFVRTYGSVGQVEPVLCNIRDDGSVLQALAGADAVVNCVGTFDKGGANNFEAVQHQGAARIARLAALAGIARLVHISAIGADVDGASLYAQSKGAGEIAVLRAFPKAVILRPSVIFGAEDQFFNRFAGMARFGPFLPLVSGTTRFQPVHVGDVALAARAGVLGKAEPGIYELGGPEADTFRGLMQRMLKVIHRRRILLPVPHFVARIIASLADFGAALSMGLIRNGLLTRDQLISLGSDNIVSDDARGFSDLGIRPVAMGAVLPDYLWRFRPSGQYDAIKDSARNLKS